MTTLASLWWLWLMVTMLAFGYVVIAQVLALKRLWNWTWGDRDYLSFKVLGSCIIASIMGHAALTCLLMGVLYRVVVYAIIVLAAL